MDRSLDCSILMPSMDTSAVPPCGLSSDLPEAPAATGAQALPPPPPAPGFTPAPGQRPIISLPDGSGVRLDAEAVSAALERAMEFRSRVAYSLAALLPGTVQVVPPDDHPWPAREEAFLAAVLRDAYGSVAALEGGQQGLLVKATPAGAREAARDREVLLRHKELWIAQKSFLIETPDGPIGRTSPWGQIDQATWYGPGVISVATPSHGGFLLTNGANDRVPEPLQVSTRAYEEDCEWARVACAFPDLFIASDVRSAHHTMKEWNPDAYASWTGRPVPLDESHTLRERKAREDLKDAYVTVSVVSGQKSGAPAGYVLVEAAKGGRMENWQTPKDRQHFLVPKNEYRAEGSPLNSPIGFVIDPHRHPEVEVRSPYVVWLPRDQMRMLVDQVLKDDPLFPDLAAKVELGLEAVGGQGWYGNLEGHEAQRLKDMAVALMEGRIISRPAERPGLDLQPLTTLEQKMAVMDLRLGWADASHLEGDLQQTLREQGWLDATGKLTKEACDKVADLFNSGRTL